MDGERSLFLCMDRLFLLTSPCRPKQRGLYGCLQGKTAESWHWDKTSSLQALTGNGARVWASPASSLAHRSPAASRTYRTATFRASLTAEGLASFFVLSHFYVSCVLLLSLSLSDRNWVENSRAEQNQHLGQGCKGDGSENGTAKEKRNVECFHII